uniref:Uncharacterized protein n=1 Tax=Mus musculus TaxID=10090 RepID=Q3U3V6_MOUSE|nr:unnamed protein product [Mus musculus]
MSAKADPDLDCLVVVGPCLPLYWNCLCRQDGTELIASATAFAPLPTPRCCDYQYMTTLEVLLVSLYFLIDITIYPVTQVKTQNSTFQVLLTTSSCIVPWSFPLSLHYFSTLLLFLV